MIRLPRFVLSLAGVATAALVLALAAPRAARAVAAALVQVTNTVSSPVVTQAVGEQAAQLVELRCFYFRSIGTCNLIRPNGSLDASMESYPVPANQSLVITSVDISLGSAFGPVGAICNQNLEVSLNAQGVGEAEPVLREFWDIPAGFATNHFAYPSGIVIPPGTTIDSVLAGPSTGVLTDSCTASMGIHGYLTAN